MTIEKPAGVGLIGAGDFGAFCVEAYAEMDEVQVVAVADLRIQRARHVAPKGAVVYRDHVELLADSDVEVVTISTPPYLHGPMASDAAAAGKHVLVEKPLATSVPAAREVLHQAQRNGVQVSVDYVLRHHPLHLLAAAIVDSQALGPLRHWSLENLATDEGLPPDHWFWDRERSGGIHVEHGVHFFDLCTSLVGRSPTEIRGTEQERSDGRVDRVAALVRYGEEVMATFYHAFNQIGRFERTTIGLNCERGRMIIEGWIPTQFRLRGWVDDDERETLNALFDSPVRVVEALDGEQGVFEHGGRTDYLSAVVEAEAAEPDREAAYRRAVQAGMRDLMAAVREGRRPIVTGEDGLRSLEIALAATPP